jgi:hypothetical protein
MERFIFIIVKKESPDVETSGLLVFGMISSFMEINRSGKLREMS